MKKYNIILADPPWTYNDKIRCGKRGVIYKYPTLSIKSIQELPIQNIADTDCTLFLWGTWPLLPNCLEIIKSWGFKYKSIAFVWIKLPRKNQLK